MAKKATPGAAAKPATPIAKAVTPPATISTPVRNSPVPKAQPVIRSKKEITQDQIAIRAYEIWASGTGGSEIDNWNRAIRELNA